MGDAFSPPKEPQTSPLATEFQPSSPRINTQTGPERKGSLPPTPGASEGDSEPEYVVVRGADLGKDGDVTETTQQKA